VNLLYLYKCTDGKVHGLFARGLLLVLLQEFMHRVGVPSCGVGLLCRGGIT